MAITRFHEPIQHDPKQFYVDQYMSDLVADDYDTLLYEIDSTTTAANIRDSLVEIYDNIDLV